MLILKPSLVKPRAKGVFVTEPLSKDEYVLGLDGLDVRFVRDEDVPDEERPLFEEYAVYTEQAEGEICGWWAPMDFEHMSIGWYLRHSKTPNLGTDDEGFSFYTKWDIQSGEELTCDYAELDLGFDNTPK